MFRNPICLILILLSHFTFASHFMGGDVFWTTDANHQFTFHVKFYRDCNGVPGPQSISLVSNAVPGGIFCSQISVTDISPVGLGCPSCSNPMGYYTAVQEYYFRSQPITLSGTVPPGGWYFEYDDCCRTGSISNLSPLGTGNTTLRAFMFADGPNNTVTGTDNSASFIHIPVMGACVGEFNELSYAAMDPDLDSLHYEFAHPLQLGYAVSGGPSDYPFAPNFSFTSPLPGVHQHSQNVPAVLNPLTGILTFKSYNAGSYMFCVKVSSWRCGVKLSEIYKDIPISILNTCNLITNPPVLNTSPAISILKAGDPVTDDTLFPGESETYTIISSDLQTDSTGSPQNIDLTLYSPQFGSNYTNPLAGCLVPPCATLSNFNPASGIASLSNTLTFPATCEHASYINGCLQHIRLYSFTIKANDRFCPIPGVKFKTLNVFVKGPEITSIGTALTGSFPGATYQWYHNGIPIANATDSVFTPIQSGFYSLIATMPGGCDMLSNTYYWGITNIDEASVNEIQNVYVDDQNRLQVLFNSSKSKQMRFDIITLDGKVARSFTADVKAGVQHLSFETGNLNEGIYLLRTGENNPGKKFILK